MADKVTVKARTTLDKDSDVSLVQRELLADGMHLSGTDVRKGDVVEITEAQAARLDEAGATAEVGTLERLERERVEAEEAAAARAEEDQQLADEEAHRRVRHAANRVDGKDDDEASAEASEKPAGTPSVASNDGPRATRRSR